MGGLMVAGLAGAAACAGAELSVRPPIREPHLAEHYRVFTNLEYAEPANRGHLLDLYLPLRADGPVPVVIFQQGSAFKHDDTKGMAVADGERMRIDQPRPSGDVISAPELASLWVPHGYAVVGLNVRSSSQVKFPGSRRHRHVDAPAGCRPHGRLPVRCERLGRSRGEADAGRRDAQ